LEKIACGAFFETLQLSRPAKGATFAGLRRDLRLALFHSSNAH